MEALWYKTNQPYECFDIAKKSEKIEKLRRKREINARYSRLLISKTIQHFQNQEHVTISHSEKLNDEINGKCFVVDK